MIKTAKRINWRNFCCSLSNKTRLGSVWKVIKGVNSVGKDNSIPDLTYNIKKTENDQEKTNVLACHFQKLAIYIIFISTKLMSII